MQRYKKMMNKIGLHWIYYADRPFFKQKGIK